jgi:acyl-coenzyme A synthetase/AMP-(fatty) acid ligase
MSSAPLPSPPALHPLIGHRAAGDILAWRRGEPITAGRFLADVAATAQALPPSRHVLNFCADRYRFAVLFAAAIVRRQVTLLPPTTTPHVIASVRAFAPDAYYVADDPATAVELPRHEMELPCPTPRSTPRAPEAEGDFVVPEAPADQCVACVFTSGSTGEPQPNYKHWGPLVANIRGEMRRMGVGSAHTVLGTVPPQHMFGFESTVLLPLVSGAAMTAERLYYPGDIDAALTRAAAPRILFTTPFHLRAWLDSHDATERVPAVERIVSATAPLSVALARRAEQAAGAELHEIYGCTEAGQVATRRTTDGPEWLPLDGLRVWSTDGQAMVAGGHVEKATALADVIEPAPDGARFRLLGRTADLVNIAGKRNSIGYLDHQLTAIEGVEDGAFFLPDEAEPDGVTRLAAFAVAPRLSAAAILARLRERIDPVFLPRPLVLVERLPRALTGKLPRAALLELARVHGIDAARRG